MSADDFNKWLSDMKERGDFRTDKDAAAALGVTSETLISYKRRGGKRWLGLACRALYHNLEPYQ
jgi:hypothetical protein